MDTQGESGLVYRALLQTKDGKESTIPTSFNILVKCFLHFYIHSSFPLWAVSGTTLMPSFTHLYPFASIDRFSTICECWDDDPEKRPKFHDLVQQISISLETETDYVDFSELLQLNSQSESGVMDLQKSCIVENGGYTMQGDIQEEEHQYDTVM